MPRNRHYKTERFYETVFVLKPTLTEEESRKIFEEVKEQITQKGGEILYEEDWGNKSMAYRIEDFSHGRYILLQFKTTNPELPNDLDFFFRINENVIRWMTFQIKEGDVLKAKK